MTLKALGLVSALALASALGLSACQEQADPRIPELERQRDAALEKSGTWQVVGTLGGIGVMLFVGAGLGSSARNKAGKQNE